MPGFLAEVLSWPENRGACLMIKSAREWNQTPLLFLVGEEYGWAEYRNRLLAAAMTLLDAETCKSCGTPVWLGHSSNNEIQFEVRTTTCYGCAELEKEQDTRVSSTGQARRKPTPGESPYVVPYNVFRDEGATLPSRQEEYARGLD